MAATSGFPPGPPFAAVHDLRTLHVEMLRRIAALEETIAQLPTPGPLEDSEIEESKEALATLKSLPKEPAKPPAEAVRAQSKLKALGERIAENLATQALTAMAKDLWARYGDQLIDLAKAIAEWIATLG